MLHRKEVYEEFSYFGISERYSEGVNDKPLFRSEDIIKDGDKVWDSVDPTDPFMMDLL